MKCPDCEFINPETNRFCGNCGRKISTPCNACGSHNPLSYSFCGYCGTDLKEGVERDISYQSSEAVNYLSLVKPSGSVTPSQRQNNAIPSEGVVSGERRIATVIVADVKKSTALLAQVGTETWVDLMRKLLNMMEAQVYRYGGKVDQFRGDGLVAFFGASDAHEDDPERAVLAALAMHEGIEQYQQDYQPLELKDLRLRIGIHTDEIILAQIGTKGMHQEDTAMGGAIALAARLETAAEPGTILVSESTFALVADRFHWMDLGKMKFKGLKEPLHVLRPLASRTEEEYLQEMQTYIQSAPLIGRHFEYDLLRQKIDRVLEGKGDVLIVSGDHGLGKSLLMSQVHQDLLLQQQLWKSYEGFLGEKGQEVGDRVGKVLWLRGWCSSYEQSSLFYIWRVLIKSWLNVEPDDSESQVNDKLEIYCQEIWTDQWQEIIPMMAFLLSFSMDKYENQLAALDAQGFQNKLFTVVGEWLCALSEKTPLIISLDSFQWANAGSLALLRESLKITEGRPILWFILCREEKDSDTWNLLKHLIAEKPDRVSQLELTPFSEEDSAGLIEHLLQPGKADRETKNIIIERAEGNPFFIRELVNGLIKEKILVKDEETNNWHLSRSITSFELPENLQSLFLSRIDSLTQTDRSVLQIASVIGVYFWRAGLEGLAPDEIDIDRGLKNLQDAGLINMLGMKSELGQGYRFSSSLIREVTYESILNNQRIKLHAEIGEFLQGYINNQDITSAFLAHHFEKAGNIQLELLYRFQAAEEAKSLYANYEAYREYTRALVILDQLEKSSTAGETYAILTQRFELVKSRIEVLYLLGRIGEAHRESSRLLEIAERLSDEHVWRIDALLSQPGVTTAENQEMLQEGIVQAEEALRLSHLIGDQHRELKSMAAVAGHRFIVKSPDWQEFGARTILMAEEMQDKKAQVDLLLAMGNAYGMDELETGLEFLKKAYPIAQEINYQAAQMELLYWMGTEYERAGDYLTLLEDFEKKRLHIAQKIGRRMEEARSLMYIGQIIGLYLGDYETALIYLEKAEDQWKEFDERLFVYLRQAQIYTELGQLDKAHQRLQLAKPLSMKFVKKLAKVGYELVEATMLLRIGTIDSLLRVVENAEKVHRMIEEENLASRQYGMAAVINACQAYLGISQILHQSDDRSGSTYYKKKAIEASGLALKTFQEFGFTQMVEVVSEEILYYHGLALKESGNSRQSDEYLEKAYKEMMRKYQTIPEKSIYRDTFLRTDLHRLILHDYEEK